MAKCSLFILAMFLAFGSVQGQQKYYVYLSDKEGVEFQPDEYFHPKALERRERCGVKVNKTDFPLQQAYVQKIVEKSDSVGFQSRWFNMVVVWSSDERIAQISELPFVRKVEKAAPTWVKATGAESEDDDGQAYLSQLAYVNFQLKRMDGYRFHKKGYRGEGVRVAVLDAGFTDADVHVGLRHVNIEATYDFVKKSSFVYDYSWHGTGVMGCIGGMFNDTQATGLATQATFLLARTERGKREYFGEEENWLAAAEWADQKGADLINSSLGYTVPRYFREQMDGEYSLVSRAAQMAFNKGIVVLTSAGNEGQNDWKYLGAPADADSVLAIGGIDAYSDRKIGFSSYGPSSDGRVKPNVVALGQGISAYGSKSQFQKQSGTSFSSPFAAGFTACYMQAYPNKTQHEVFNGIQESAHLYPYFDYVHGYGVPVAWKALGEENAWQEGDGKLISEGGDLYLQVEEKYFFEHLNADSSQLARKNIYFHVEAENGILMYYAVLNSSDPKTKILSFSDYPEAQTIRVHFEGKTLSHHLK